MFRITYTYYKLSALLKKQSHLFKAKEKYGIAYHLVVCPDMAAAAARAGVTACVIRGPEIIVFDPGAQTRRVLLHEQCHVKQHEQPFFQLRYLTASAMYGYKNNPYELDARAAEHGCVRLNINTY